MNYAETPAGADLSALLAEHVVEPSVISKMSPDSLELGAQVEANGTIDTPEHAPDQAESDVGGETAEQAAYLPDRHVDPNGPTAAEVGAHFATQISENAVEALGVAARLGPKRVLALLV